MWKLIFLFSYGVEKSVAIPLWALHYGSLLMATSTAHANDRKGRPFLDVNDRSVIVPR
jgi:hypothetical protein